MRYLVILLSFILSAGRLSAQESRHYTAVDGLLGTDVTAICENENFLWIATNEGLNRFDGREFKTYKKESGCDNCLSENNIETLMFDSNGLLWIGLKTGGVDIYNPRKDRFTHISQCAEIYPHRVISIFEDSEKNIWLGSWEEGIYKLEALPGQSLAYKVSGYYPGQIVSSIIEKPKGTLWIGTYSQYHAYDIGNDRWLNPDNDEFLITQLHDAGEPNTIWASTWEEGLLKISWTGSDLSSAKTEQYLSGYRYLYRLYQASDKRLFLGTWGKGLKMVETDSENIREIPVKSDIKSPVILCFFRDRYNKTWIGTYGNGLFRLNEEKEGTDYLGPIHKNGLSAAYKVKYWKKNYLLIGTQGDGLYVYDLKKEQLSPMPVNFANRTLFNNFILSIYCDDRLLIVGHDDFGIYYTPLNGKEDMGNIKLNRFFADNELAKVTAVFKGGQSRIWIGTKQNGLISIDYDAHTETFANYTHYRSFVRDEITGFAAFDDDRLWISTHSGLYLFNTRTNQTEKNGRPIVSDMVYSLLDDPGNQCLWLGTSVGLRQMDYSDTSRVKQVFHSELLPEGAIRDLTLDAANNLWFSIVDRVFCFINGAEELKEINTYIFDNQNILSASRAEINEKEWVVFGGTNRLLLINPSVELRRAEQTKIVLTELQIDHQKVNVNEKVYGKVVLKEAAEYVNSLSLSYLCKWISLSFKETGWNHFRDKYQYRIQGFSNEWQYFDITKPLTFSQLQPGEYTLFVRHYEASPEENPYWSLHIVIRPPWWKTFWFYGTLAVSFIIMLAVTASGIKNHYKKRQQLRLYEIEKKKKEELLQEKESFFAGLSHDLMTPFSLIIAPVNDLLREKNLPEDKMEKLAIISKNASFLSDIFSSMLDLKRVEIIDAEIRGKNVELVSFCRIIINAFEYLAKSKQITIDFRSDVSCLTAAVDTVKLERIIYNLLSNAVKFTPEGGFVHVRLMLQNPEHLVLEIADTGAGIDAAGITKVFDKFYRVPQPADKNPNGLGLGLYIVRKFVRMLGGDIKIESEPGKGSTFIVDLPIRPIQETAFADERNEEDERPSILLAEDNEQMLDYLKKRLSSHFQVSTAGNGREALEFIKKDIPEIVVSDVMMPEMDGLELCALLKATPMFSDIFVVLLSAKSSTEDELRGYKAGADFYVKKPFDSEILVNQIINVYTTRRRQKKQIINDLLSSAQTSDIHKDDFLSRAVRIIEEHLMNEDFKIDEFASEMNLSKTVLHRKFKVIIGETPTIFIRNVRLHKAANMLKDSELSVAEVAYLTGFSQSHYFIKCFKELFGDTPKNYRKSNRKG